MLSVLFIRHGRTDWNDEGRLQGHHDIDLNSFGREQMRLSSIPQQWRDAHWYSSPLLRTVHSAKLLGAVDLRIDTRLIEMFWGQWEGQKLPDLRARLGAQMQENEAQGLDFRPSGGESPREVRTRLQHWLMSMVSEYKDSQRLIVVTHKGVIRSALSLASDWQMRDKFASRLDWNCAHAFSVSSAGDFCISQLNLPLVIDEAQLTQ